MRRMMSNVLDRIAAFAGTQGRAANEQVQQVRKQAATPENRRRIEQLAARLRGSSGTTRGR